MKTIKELEKIIKSRIYVLRGQKVMLDRDLAELYGVETRVLNQAVMRNKERFPQDFMFQLSVIEVNHWKSQIVISNKEKMGLRKKPYVFTENGVAMLSSVLKSKQAVKVNIEIMRTFTKVREMMRENKVLWKKIRAIEKKYDGQFRVVFDALRALVSVEKKSKRKIGFHHK